MPHCRSYYSASHWNEEQWDRWRKDRYYRSSAGEGRSFASIPNEDAAAVKCFAKARARHRELDSLNHFHSNNPRRAAVAANVSGRLSSDGAASACKLFSRANWWKHDEAAFPPPSSTVVRAHSTLPPKSGDISTNAPESAMSISPSSLPLSRISRQDNTHNSRIPSSWEDIEDSPSESENESDFCQWPPLSGSSSTPVDIKSPLTQQFSIQEEASERVECSASPLHTVTCAEDESAVVFSGLQLANQKLMDANRDLCSSAAIMQDKVAMLEIRNCELETLCWQLQSCSLTPWAGNDFSGEVIIDNRKIEELESKISKLAKSLGEKVQVSLDSRWKAASLDRVVTLDSLEESVAPLVGPIVEKKLEIALGGFRKDTEDKIANLQADSDKVQRTIMEALRVSQSKLQQDLSDVVVRETGILQQTLMDRIVKVEAKANEKFGVSRQAYTASPSPSSAVIVKEATGLDRFPVGTIVWPCSLKANELNGKKGQVVDYDPRKKRFLIQFEYLGPEAQPKLLLAENLVAGNARPARQDASESEVEVEGEDADELDSIIARMDDDTNSKHGSSSGGGVGEKLVRGWQGSQRLGSSGSSSRNNDGKNTFLGKSTKGSSPGEVPSSDASSESEDWQS